MTVAPARPEAIAMEARSIDARELRKALGTFMTGVTVITTMDSAGHPRGFTANSFTSVSLEPPLVLVCVDHNALSYPVYAESEYFAVNMLTEDQRDLSGTFAGKAPDKFSFCNWHKEVTGSPIIDESLSWVDCRVHKRIEAGDHMLLLGEVQDFHHTSANPLGYFRGAYVTSASEQEAMPEPGQKTRIGAILEYDGQVLLREDGATGSLELPSGSTLGPTTRGQSLWSQLQGMGLDVELGFIFAVFEHTNGDTLEVYYRGQIRQSPADSPGVVLAPLDDIPWDRLDHEASRSMLKRYVNERLEDRFGVYVGDFEAGHVRPLERGNV